MDVEKRLPYFFLGLGIGVAIGILFAPKSGEETRGYLKSKAEEGKDYVRRRSADLRESAADLVERGKQTVIRQKEQIAAAVEAGKQAYRETVSGEPAKGAAEENA